MKRHKAKKSTSVITAVTQRRGFHLLNNAAARWIQAIVCDSRLPFNNYKIKKRLSRQTADCVLSVN